MTWNLASDFQLAPNQANPNPDACGQADVWHFLESTSLDRDPAAYTLLPDFVQDIAGIFGLEGWRGNQYPELPVIGLNATGMPQTSETWVWPPDVIYVHPAPTNMVIAGWRSPVDGVVAILGSVRDLDGNGGDGIEWYIDKGTANLASGEFWDGGDQNFMDGTGGSGLANVSVSQGEFIYFVVHPRWDHDYDSTELDITITLVQPPSNDDFAEARIISEVPFSDGLNTWSAGVEEGERIPSCAYYEDWSRSKTVWYAFTPLVSGSYSLRLNSGFWAFMAAYTGDSLANLQEIGCCDWGMLTLSMDAGVTYYFQVGGQEGGGGWLTFYLDVAPQPEANFGFYPDQPSSFDTIWFYDGSWDPAGVGFQSQEWDFGDGTTADGCCPSHRYAADGDYIVQLTVTTWDGRTASTSRVVSVRTHDVAITRFAVPGAAKAGQTRSISVGVNSPRYPETVEVQLFKSIPGGYEWVGSLRQYVPVRPANRTTNFSFNYTFTSQDAQIGKVTFRAYANIVDAWDALPADNEAIAPPTTVK